MTVEMTAEFDAFGPWIDKVGGRADVPRLYAEYPIDFATARLVLKVPRNIARRDANPRMDLYDHLLIAGDSALTVLSRQGTTYTESSLAYSTIAAMSESVNVLDAVFSIWSTTGVTVHIPFNGAGASAITSLTSVIRSQIGAADAVPPVSPYAAYADLAELGPADVSLSGRFRALERAEPHVRLLAAFGRRHVYSLTGRDRWLRRTHALGALVLATTPSELHVLARHEAVNAGRKPDLSHRHTVVRLADITSVETAVHERFGGLSRVTLGLGEATLELVVLTDSECERALAGLV